MTPCESEDVCASDAGGRRTLARRRHCEAVDDDAHINRSGVRRPPPRIGELAKAMDSSPDPDPESEPNRTEPNRATQFRSAGGVCGDFSESEITAESGRSDDV